MLLRWDVVPQLQRALRKGGPLHGAAAPFYSAPRSALNRPSGACSMGITASTLSPARRSYSAARSLRESRAGPSEIASASCLHLAASDSSSSHTLVRQLASEQKGRPLQAFDLKSDAITLSVPTTGRRELSGTPALSVVFNPRFFCECLARGQAPCGCKSIPARSRVSG